MVARAPTGPADGPCPADLGVAVWFGVVVGRGAEFTRRDSLPICGHVFDDATGSARTSAGHCSRRVMRPSGASSFIRIWQMCVALRCVMADPLESLPLVPPRRSERRCVRARQFGPRRWLISALGPARRGLLEGRPKWRPGLVDPESGLMGDPEWRVAAPSTSDDAEWMATCLGAAAWADGTREQHLGLFDVRQGVLKTF